MRTSLTIKVAPEDQALSAEDSAAILASLLGFLHELSREETGQVVKWELVAASMASPLTLSFAVARKYSKAAAELPGQAVGLLRDLSSPIDDVPAAGRRYSETTLQKAGRLGVARKSIKVSISSGTEEPLALTPVLSHNVHRVLQQRKRGPEYGSYTGRLELVSVHGDPYFCIWSELDGREVRCRFPDAQTPDVLPLVKKRITVSGWIESGKRKSSIEVERFRELPGAEALDLSNLPRIDITHGEDPEAFVRRLRGNPQ